MDRIDHMDGMDPTGPAQVALGVFVWIVWFTGVCWVVSCATTPVPADPLIEPSPVFEDVSDAGSSSRFEPVPPAPSF